MSSDERLSELHIENFRCFKEFHATSLGDVNLLIGKNNGGKTTFLEAIEFKFQILYKIFISCVRRKEFSIKGNKVYLDLKNIFHNKEILNKIIINNRFLEIKNNQIIVYDDLGNSSLGPFEENDSFVAKEMSQIWIENIQKNKIDFNVVETDFFKSNWMHLLWDTIVGNNEEDLVTDMMKIIDPNIERIVFTISNPYSAPFVKLKGINERVHLGSLGEGAKRLLALAMIIVKSKNRIFLIDEIDLGFHYSVMFKLWSILLEWSRKYKIQIFATTHSQDCLHALYKIIKNDQISDCDIKILRIDKDQTQPTVYEPEDLLESVGEGIEIR